jgi:hypothetical protein
MGQCGSAATSTDSSCVCGDGSGVPLDLAISGVAD